MREPGASPQAGIEQAFSPEYLFVEQEVEEEGGVDDEGDEESHEGDHGEGVEEDEAEDVALFAVAVGGGGGDDDALGVDHFAHDAATGVGGGHDVGRDA